MVVYVVNSLIAAICLATLILGLTYGRKIKYPKGFRYTDSYRGFTSTVILDIADETMGARLAYATAVAMWSTSKTVNTYGPAFLQKGPLVDHCVFTFLHDKRYREVEIGFGLIKPSEPAGKRSSNGIAWFLTSNMGNKLRSYCCYIPMIHALEVLKNGQVAVHEYLHCLAYAADKDWDKAHTLWETPVFDNKNVDILAKEQAAEILSSVDLKLV